MLCFNNPFENVRMHILLFFFSFLSFPSSSFPFSSFSFSSSCLSPFLLLVVLPLETRCKNKRYTHLLLLFFFLSFQLYGDASLRFDQVYIDANPILHKIGRAQSREVTDQEYLALMQSFQSSDKLCQNLPFTRRQIDQLNAVPFFRSLYDSFHAILFRFQATHRLYISVDGPASLAKLKTQRERRKENEEEESGLRLASFFNRRKFTPGNLFMGL